MIISANRKGLLANVFGVYIVAGILYRSGCVGL